MPGSPRRLTAIVGAAALALGAASSASAAALTAAPAPARPAAASPAAASPAAATPAPAPAVTPTGTRSVDYRGVHLSVPSDWAVVDLDADPTRCVRLDVRAVYLGRPGSQQDCPAHLVGRAETIWLHPGSDRASTATTSRTTTLGTLRAHTGTDRAAGTTVARFTAQDVQVDATWGSSESRVDDVLATATASSAATRTGPAAGTAAATSSTSSASSSSATATASPGTASTAATSGPHPFTGMAFDACAAPSVATMQSWLASPYRAVGIYIGGSMRACGDGNLSSTWVSQVSSMGWGLIPIYVGPQAPCV